MTIRIIGAGFGRTGTTSLKVALEKLGIGPCYHMEDASQNPSHAALWRDAMTKRVFHWPELLRGYQATVDWPSSAFYRELSQEYPNAKVILTLRDPEAWYASAYKTSYRDQIHPEMYEECGWPPVVDEMVKAVIWAGTFAGKFEEKEYAIDVFLQHIENVKRAVPAEKLLIYEVKQGWGPLCEFLEVPIPTTEPFPYLNTTTDYFSEIDVRWTPPVQTAQL